MACYTRQKRGATPLLVQRVELGGLGDTDDVAVVTDARPLHDAVRPAECAQRVERSIAPECRDARRVPRTVDEAGDESRVADAGGAIARAVEVVEIADRVARRGYAAFLQHRDARVRWDLRIVTAARHRSDGDDDCRERNVSHEILR
jgi:hypothetical protein